MLIVTNGVRNAEAVKMCSLSVSSWHRCIVFAVSLSFLFVCKKKAPSKIEREEKIYFPKSLQWYILSHLFKIYRQRLRWSRMINFDHLPATPWFFLINFFFLGTPFCHVQYHMLCHERGNAIYSQKLFTLFLKKQGKEFNFHLLLEFGQMKSGKRTRGERRRKHNCIVSCSSVCTWKWGTLSRDFTYYYWLMQWSSKLKIPNFTKFVFCRLP